MTEFVFESFDKKPIHVYEWADVAEPKAIIQIGHGMVEHAGRYAKFAEEMNRRGYVVFADDHRAHGKTDEQSLGVAEGDAFEDTVRDMSLLTDLFAKKYDLPVILYGHSYGSFLARRYIELYGDKLCGAIIGGSCRMSTPVLCFGVAVASVICACGGKDKPSGFFKKMSFDAYNAKFKEGTFISSIPSECERYKEDKFCTFICSNGFYKSFFKGILRAQKDKNLSLIPKSLPILLVSGEDDPVGEMGKGVVRLQKSLVKHGLSVKTVLYEGVRHEYLNDTAYASACDEISRFCSASI